MATITHTRLSKTKSYFILLFLVSFFNSRSQDIKMGYMQIKWLFGYTYADTTYLLTDLATDVNRPFILTNWGVKIDTSKLVQTSLTNNGYLKKYYGTCSYPGPGNYFISWQDSYRIGNINNILQSNSQSIKLSTLLGIQLFGSPINSSPILQNKNITLSVQTDSVVFKPNFLDIEGDSLSYQLTPCFASNYYTPNGATIDNYGNLYFNKDSIGIYAFSLIVKEWRDDGAGTNINIQSSQLDFIMNITTDVSLNYIDEFENVRIYPNPTTSIINIVDENNQLQNATIQIRNNLGKLVFSSRFNSQIDLSGISTGMYFLTVKDKFFIKPIKIIKN
jgi:hypothetical protein